MNDVLKNALWSLGYEPSPERLEEVMQLSQFDAIVKRVYVFEKGPDEELTVNYLQDVVVFSLCRIEAATGGVL